MGRVEELDRAVTARHSHGEKGDSQWGHPGRSAEEVMERDSENSTEVGPVTAQGLKDPEEERLEPKNSHQFATRGSEP